MEKRFYIVGGATGAYNYCLSPNGLSRVTAYAPLIFGVSFGNEFLGMSVDLTALGTDEVVVETDWFNFGSMDLKTITQVALNFKTPSPDEKTITATIYYQSEDGTTGSVASIDMGRLGFTRTYVTAVAFRIKITIAPTDEATDEAWENLVIDDLVVNFQQSDKRFRRSINVGSTARQ